MIILRSIKSVITRNVMKVYTKIRQKTQISREVTNGFNKAMREISRITQKPTEKEDFYETRNLYISKNYIFKLVMLTLLAITFAYFVLYPLAMRYLFTGKYCISDSSLEEYTGDVIVYYDDKKTVPCYEGRLEDGKLEGDGVQYDVDGVVEYKGNFSGHERSGKGEEYKKGELVYKGEFANGVYEGKGELYEKGKLVFSGSFLGGLKDGTDCIVYYTNGRPSYRGTFTENEQTGNGIAYYESGVQKYSGSFVKGNWDGTGTYYNEEGDIVYVGGFTKNAFNGSGVLYLSNGFRMEAEFFSGIQGGDVVITRNGNTFYEGGAENCVLSGQGVFYNKAGKKVYEGDVRGGTVDGRFLLGKSIEDVKSCLGEVELTEKRSENSVWITSDELGLCVYFNVTGGADEEIAEAYDASLCDSAKMSIELSLLLWTFAKDTDSWRKAMWEDSPILAGQAEPQYSALAFLEKTTNCIIYRDGKSDCALWMKNGSCFMLQWTRAEAYVIR